MNSFRRIIETLHPAYFDVVMATGIIALAAQLERMRALSLTFTYLNIVLCVVLLAMNAIRLIWRETSFIRDLADFERGPGYFTIAAGLAIVGSQMLRILSYPGIALALWAAALALWICLNYAIFVEATINERKPRFEDGINGGWLISVVAMQSVAVLAADLAGEYTASAAVLFAGLILWLAGGMLYIWLIALIFYRFTFFRFRPEHFMPPFWINMGAMASAAFAGATLAENAHRAAFLSALLPFIDGLTILFWATASWWIPMLAILAAWQHLIKKLNRPYSPLYWSAVFPLGMYTVSTYKVSQTMNLTFLMWIPRVFIYIALVAWLGTLVSMVHSTKLGRVLERDLSGGR